jgi:hypothetical protein
MQQLTGLAESCLLEGWMLTQDLIDAWPRVQRTSQVTIRRRPTPHELAPY